MPNLEGALYEGFANHNVLRYAMFRHRESVNRGHDSFSISYDAGMFSGDAIGYTIYDRNNYLVKEIIDKGQKMPALYASGSNPGLEAGLFFSRSSTVCKGIGNEKHKYDCGSVLGRIYWELAWNTCRVSYKTCIKDKPILTTSSYASNAERLANVAFTCAIKSVSDMAPDSYFSSVSRCYNDFYSKKKWISKSEVRVG